jgi:Sec7-like guanine-nucleotide exchange factor
VLTVSRGEARSRVRKEYLSLFDWKGVNILSAMRILCGRLVFKGETQQVDRIMVSFAHRWCECNPNHGFKNVGTCSMEALGYPT